MSLIGHLGAYHGTCCLPFSSMEQQHWHAVCVFLNQDLKWVQRLRPKQGGTSSPHVRGKYVICLIFIMCTSGNHQACGKCHGFLLTFISDKTSSYYLSSFFLWKQLTDAPELKKKKKTKRKKKMSGFETTGVLSIKGLITVIKKISLWQILN